MSVQAGLTYLCSFNVCTFGAWLRLFCLDKNRRLGAYDILKTEEQKNKRDIEEFNIHSNKFDAYSNSSMPAPVALVCNSLFRKEQKIHSFVSFKNTALCTYKLVCMMNVWQK